MKGPDSNAGCSAKPGGGAIHAILAHIFQVVKGKFHLFGYMTFCKIKKYLESHGIKTVTGKEEWSTSTIDRMLSNEKYVGDVLMQKTYTADYLTGKKEKNRGQVEMYLVEDAHEPIIDRETFDKVQEMKGHIKETQK